MNITPLVSIIIPAYNHENYIQSCLESIIHQDYPNIELLVCDDCSTDGTYQILQQYKDNLEQKFQRVLIHRNEVNQGVVKNMNSMITQAKGKYIKSIASDDMLMPGCITGSVEFYERHADYDLVFSNAVYCDEHSRYPYRIQKKDSLGYAKEPDLSGNLMQKLYENNFILAPTVIFQKQTFERWGLYDENYTIEDWEYWLRIAQNGKIGYNGIVTVAYRIITTSLSHFTNSESGHKRLENMYENQLAILQKYENCDRIDAEAGYRSLYRRMLHEAIDTDYSMFAGRLRKQAAKQNIKLDMETQLKYLAYRLHVLRAIQGIKRFLHMETADVNKRQ